MSCNGNANGCQWFANGCQWFATGCQWLPMVANGRKWVAKIGRIGIVIWLGKVYIAQLVPVGNTSCFIRQITSHPAHISNLGKVSNQYLTNSIHFCDSTNEICFDLGSLAWDLFWNNRQATKKKKKRKGGGVRMKTGLKFWSDHFSFLSSVIKYL